VLWLYPTFIAPLFNRFTPLEDEQLKARVEEMARQAGFSVNGIHVMDASRRSGHSNAYFTGFGKNKRIVLFDTLLAHMAQEETLAVLAHEIGHYRLNHVKKRMGLSMAMLLGLLLLVDQVIAWPPAFQAFGLGGPTPHGALALLALVGGAFTFWFSPLLSWYSRAHEFAADHYAVTQTGQTAPLMNALIKLSRENLSNLSPHPWYVAYHYSHPTLPQRLAAVQQS